MSREAGVVGHTPGPWVAKPTMLKAVYIGSPSGPVAVTSSSSNVDRDTNIANASLIAAAPDLLAALEAVSEYLHGIPESAVGGDDEAVRLARIARAALSKARGLQEKQK